jgi:tellurite resistance protein TehA-like permease
MCGMPIWGIAAALGCSYLAYLSYGHVRRGEFDWPHDAWFIVTYAVWVMLMAGLMSETRCLRERIFFALVLANFTLGFVLAIWGTAPLEAVRGVRVISTGLWSLAALVSLAVTFSSRKRTSVEKKTG